MSKTFIFQTGHGKGLSKAELIALLGDVITDEVHDGFVLETELDDPLKLQNRLGGTVRITEVLQSGPAHMPLNFAQWVTDALIGQLSSHEGKKRFGLSMHPKNDHTLKKTLNTAKKDAKTDLGNVRYVNKDFQNLSSVQAWHEKLLNPGAIELHLFRSESKWYLSKTLTIQDFEWYSKRDYERPKRDSRNGMLPPKLSQILINLAVDKNTSVVVDPFCGNGTLLQEALLMGFNTQGSDLSEEKVEDSKTNLKWLMSEAIANGTPIENNHMVFPADATKLTEKEMPVNSAIATETWLGPAISIAPKPLERPKLQREIEQLYEDFFSNLKKIIKAPTSVVFTAAYYKEKNDRYFLPNLPEILKKHAELVPLSPRERASLFYERKGQVVGREIWKLIVKPV